MHRELFLTSVVLFALVSFDYTIPSEGDSLTWSTTIGGAGCDEAHVIIKAPSGGYVVAGSTTSFGANSTDCLLVRLDEFGNVVWQQVFGGAEYDRVYSLINTSDGGYALAGATHSFGASESDFWLVKTNSTGHVEWNKRYGRCGTDVAYSVTETSDGGYILAGSTVKSRYDWGYGKEDGWLVKTDARGNMEWNQLYGGADTDIIYSVEEYYIDNWRSGPEEGYRLSGVTSSYGGGRVAYWSFTANESGYCAGWSSAGKGTDGWVTSVVSSSSGGYKMAGYIDTADGDYDAWLDYFLYDDEEPPKTYGGTGNDVVHSLIKTSDGDYVLAGYTESFGSWSSDVWLVKTNASGSLLWNRTYGKIGDDVAYSVIETPDGGYAIAGSTDKFDNGNHDFWVIKTDKDGFVPDLNPVYIDMISPQNTTYNPNSVSLHFHVAEQTSWMGYCLDGQAVASIFESEIPLVGLSNGLHNLTVYVVDVDGKPGTSETVYFTTDPQVLAETITDTILLLAIIATAAATGIIVLFRFRKGKKATKVLETS